MDHPSAGGARPTTSARCGASMAEGPLPAEGRRKNGLLDCDAEKSPPATAAAGCSAGAYGEHVAVGVPAPADLARQIKTTRRYGPGGKELGVCRSAVGRWIPGARYETKVG